MTSDYPLMSLICIGTLQKKKRFKVLVSKGTSTTKNIHIEEATHIGSIERCDQNVSLSFGNASFFCKNTVGETHRQLYKAGNNNVEFATRTCTGLKRTILAV